jgi:hypothetical protein
MNVAKMDDRMTTLETQSKESVQRLDQSPNKSEVVYQKEFEPFKTDLMNQFQSLDNRLTRMESKQDRVIELLLGRARVSIPTANAQREIVVAKSEKRNTLTPAERNGEWKFWNPVVDLTKDVFITGKND